MIEAVLLGLTAGMAMLALYWEREAWRERARREALEARLLEAQRDLVALTNYQRELVREARTEGFRRKIVEQVGATLAPARFSRN